MIMKWGAWCRTLSHLVELARALTVYLPLRSVHLPSARLSPCSSILTAQPALVYAPLIPGMAMWQSCPTCPMPPLDVPLVKNCWPRAGPHLHLLNPTGPADNNPRENVSFLCHNMAPAAGDSREHTTHIFLLIITYPNFPGVERAHGQFVPMRKSHREACFFAAEVRVKNPPGKQSLRAWLLRFALVVCFYPSGGCPSLPANLINLKWPRNAPAAAFSGMIACPGQAVHRLQGII